MAAVAVAKLLLCCDIITSIELELGRAYGSKQYYGGGGGGGGGGLQGTDQMASFLGGQE